MLPQKSFDITLVVDYKVIDYSPTMKMLFLSKCILLKYYFSWKSLCMIYCQCSELHPLNLSSCLLPTVTGFPAEVQELLDQQQNLSAGSVSLQLSEPELRLYVHPEPCCLPGPAVWPGGKRSLFSGAAAGSRPFSQAIWSSPGRFFPASVLWSLMGTPIFFSHRFLVILSGLAEHVW